MSASPSSDSIRRPPLRVLPMLNEPTGLIEVTALLRVHGALTAVSTFHHRSPRLHSVMT